MSRSTLRRTASRLAAAQQYELAKAEPDQIEAMIIASKKDKPHWGARKIRELLVRKLAGDVRLPSTCTVLAVLDRHGLVTRARQRRRCKAEGTPLSAACCPNDLWCVDFKGEFRLGNRQYCYPLTVTDQASRMILLCEALESTREVPVVEAFVRLFKQRGLPAAIRSDNGLPFASPNGLYNLSRLSVFWLRLGIDIERIDKLADGSLKATLKDGRVLEADCVFYATGRRPMLDNLGLENAGVALDERGTLEVLP